MFNKRSDLIRAVVRELSTPTVKFEINNFVYSLSNINSKEIQRIDISDYNDKYVIVVYFYYAGQENNHTCENGMDTYTGAQNYQLIIMTQRSKVYNKFKTMVEERYNEAIGTPTHRW